MPFLERYSLVPASPTVRTSRGFEDGFWDAVDFITEVSARIGIPAADPDPPLIPRRVLDTERCPGAWRVYYHILAAEPGHDIPFSRPTYLGMPTASFQTTRVLGKAIERWVSQANRVYNDFLSSPVQDLAILQRIESPTLRDFYLTRAQAHLRVCPIDRLESQKMDVEVPLDLFPRVLDPANPDGLFQTSRPMAVFESKLSYPLEEGPHDTQLATYALLLEKKTQEPCDYAVVLHSTYPHEFPAVIRRVIREGMIARVAVNLSRLREVIEGSVSLRAARGEDLRLIDSWKDLAARPPGMPAPEEREPCEACPVKARCWSEGATPATGAT